MDTNLNVHDASVIVGDTFVSATVSRVVEAIHDYEPLIEVQWLPPAARGKGDSTKPLPAFKLVYHDPNGHPFTLFHVYEESEFDERVLMRIIANDNRHRTVSRTEYETWEETQRLMQKQKYLDELEAAADIAAHIIKSPLNKYVVDKDFIIKEGIPFNAAKLKD